MQDLTDVSVVLPSLDPDEKLTAVIDGLLEYGFKDIILVNDGSKPENLHYFTDAAAAHPEISLLHHPVNLGKGAALKTAFRYFLENRPQGLGVVTVDGDNQHHPADTAACVEAMLRTGHLVLGVRDFDQPDVPFRSRNGNKITSFVFKVFVGMTISDTQTGLRALPRPDVETLVQIAGDRFEYETNMLLAMQRLSIPFEEVPIRTVYIEENKSSHFRAVRDSWRIYKLILAHFFRYTGVSVLSAVVDEGLFLLLLSHLYDPLQAAATIPATLGARAVSSLMNFTLNRNLVFKAKGNSWAELRKYYALAVPVALVQTGATWGLNQLLPESFTFLRTASHAIVMIVLYFLTFIVQQRWVFKNKNQQK